MANLTEIKKCHRDSSTVEDWSGVENMYKMRPERKITSFNDLFSLREKISAIFPRVISRYGIKGIFHIYKSAKKINPLSYDGTLGYFLTRGQKTF